jgi:hypothetical protein
VMRACGMIVAVFVAGLLMDMAAGTAASAESSETSTKNERLDLSKRPGFSEQPNDGPLFRTEAASVMADLLSKSSLQNITIFDAEKVSRMKSHAAWSNDYAVGTVTIMLGDSTALLKEMPQYVIAKDAANCKSGFRSGTVPEDTRRQTSRAFTFCQVTPDRSATSYYLGVPRKKGGIFVFHTASRSEALARSADEAIMKVALDSTH